MKNETFLITGFCLYNYGLEVQDNRSVSSSKLHFIRAVSISYVALGTFTFGLSLCLAIQTALYTTETNHQLCTPFSLNNHTDVISARHFVPSLFHHNV